MAQQLTYPSHIYDATRVELAISIINKELRKLFLGVSTDAWQAMDASVRGWANQPTDYHLETERLQDFWDSFAAIMHGIKLKPNFVAWITAENIEWSKQTLDTRTIQMTSPLKQLQKVHGLNLRVDLLLGELAEILANNPAAKAEQKTFVDQHSTDPAQDEYPIIVRKTSGGVIKVMDGNRRALRAVIYDQPQIEAWVGEMKQPEPINYWVAIADMYQLVVFYKAAVEKKDTHTQSAIAGTLRNIFDTSSVAQIAYQHRVAGQVAVAQQLYDVTQQL